MLNRFSIRCGASTGLVDTEQALSEILGTLRNLPTSPPSLYVDLEGINLSRHGSISILQLLVLPTGQTHLIDVYKLRERAFGTRSAHGDTLRGILESPAIPKVFFDVRQDSDALYNEYAVSLRGVQDLQLMELASRKHTRRFVCGLAKCVEKDAGLSYAEIETWRAGKDKGSELFKPGRGGSFALFNQRPLLGAVWDYCVEDVRFLPRLWQIYDGRLASEWRARVEMATVDRVLLSRSDAHTPGPHMTLAPAGWVTESLSAGAKVG
jgi:exonuclease 3'-5' domain-containing protein 1